MKVPAWLGVIALIWLSATSSPAASQDASRVNPVGAAVHTFQQRLADYVKVHKEADKRVPSLSETKDSAKISAREKALGDMIRQLRASAKPGDVFCEEVRPILIDVIRQDFKTRTATDRKALVEEIPANVKLAINMTYPTSLPLATFPAKLLGELPELPPELEYRIFGRHLILRDVKANIVVDYLRDIVPTLPS